MSDILQQQCLANTNLQCDLALILAVEDFTSEPKRKIIIITLLSKALSEQMVLLSQMTKICMPCNLPTQSRKEDCWSYLDSIHVVVSLFRTELIRLHLRLISLRLQKRICLVLILNGLNN